MVKEALSEAEASNDSDLLASVLFKIYDESGKSVEGALDALAEAPLARRLLSSFFTNIGRADRATK